MEKNRTWTSYDHPGSEIEDDRQIEIGCARDVGHPGLIGFSNLLQLKFSIEDGLCDGIARERAPLRAVLPPLPAAQSIAH